MNKLVEQLKRHEGLELSPYKDTVGKLTIGYGRNLDDVGISEKEAEFMLRNDIAIAITEADKAFDWLQNLNDARKDVVYNMVFNMGLPRFKGFKKMIAALERNYFAVAADEMMDSRWAQQVGIRALELQNQMLTGKYQ
jgi:lysozyme